MLRTTARRWLPLAAVSTALSILVYLAVQQVQRSDANDPQIQLAEDAVHTLERGAALASVIPAGKVEMEFSLAPFVIAYDPAGRAVAGSGALRGRLPAPPAGVFDFVRAHGEERVTWQPERGVRIASVVRRAEAPDIGFVLAGRSLREVERREEYTRLACAGALGVLLVGSFVVVLLSEVALASRA